MDLSVEDGLVLTPDGVVEADVGVQDGRIEEVGSVEDADRRLDAGGCVVVPGLVNAHTHASMSLLRGYADDLPLDVWLEDHIWPVESQLTADDVETGARLAAAEMVAGGTTAFADMYFHMDRVAAAVDDAGLRATLGYGVITAGKTKEEARRELREGVEFAVEHDGAADGRVSTMLCPHAPYTCDDESLEEAARLAREHGLRLHVHLSETASEVEDSVEDNGVRPPEHLDSLGFFDGDVYVAHGVHLDADDRGLLAQRDVG
ncbi:MAG: amidohydrolase family protein, partial [Halobacteriota archaeon]